MRVLDVVAPGLATWIGLEERRFRRRLPTSDLLISLRYPPRTGVYYEERGHGIEVASEVNTIRFFPCLGGLPRRLPFARGRVVCVGPDAEVTVHHLDC
jgi:hypothetical protein